MRVHTILLALLAGCSTGNDFGATTTTGAPPTDAVTSALDGDADTDADADADTDADTDTDTDTTDTGTLPCANVVVDQFPDDGQVDVYFGSEVFFTLASVDATATITVADTDGTVIPGATTVEGTLVRWAGGPLATSTDYEATLTHACGVQTAGFATSDVGDDPLAADVSGDIYTVDLGSGVWAQPVGLGMVLASLFSSQEMLLSPIAFEPSTVDFLGGIGEESTQDMCVPTVPMPQTRWADPTFELVAPLVQLDFGGLLVDATDVEVTGSFAEDGSRIQFGRFDAVIDTRRLGPSIGLSNAYDEVCNLVSTLDISCEPCDDGLPYCLSVSVDDLEAPNVGGALVPRTAAEIAADPACVE